MEKKLKLEPSRAAESAGTGHTQRRERRYPFLIPIEVSGIDRGGQPFCENTLTSDVSARGCRFLLQKELEKDAIVAIRVLRTLSGQPGDSRLVMFQIIYIRQDPGGWTMGAWTLQPDVAWCSDIPRDPDQER